MAIRWIIVGLLTAWAAGCTDSDGNRITMQQWWNGGSASSAPTSEEADSARAVGERSPEESRTASDSDQARHSKEMPTKSTKSAPRRPPPGAIFADTLPIHGETIRVGDILEPIQPKLEKMATELPAQAYYQRAADIVRLQIVENVAQQLIWRRASAQINDDIKPQLEKAIDKTEKDRINREFQGRETLYEQFLSKHGKTRTDVRERLRRAIVIDSYLRDRLLPMVPQPRRSELLEYYESHRAEFSRPEQREMWLIEVPVEAFLDFRKPVSRADEQEATRKAREKIEQAAAALARGDAFDVVAREYSMGPHREDGGAWGSITAASDNSRSPLQGRWAEPSRKLFELSPGGTSEIVEADKCFFIVRTGEIKPGKNASFQEAQPHIVDSLKQQRFAHLRADFLQKELDSATIGSLDDFMRMVMDAIPPSTDKTARLERGMKR
ncbi:MAG: peptidyl-prolyl cis-trans isomerase [Planctomycetia bacterium]|nr:peptidyl-prolyl cis-trans isomerase [Planctomycetia bacterium]MCC7313401.1 peptidyl-prolyl cis-trans isomerase [Planctomycetota bacterium]OQZ06286.1 MAG: hypothetical protein B6D36_05755 [Planctomycetes bacterium UTPLA1]